MTVQLFSAASEHAVHHRQAPASVPVVSGKSHPENFPFE